MGGLTAPPGLPLWSDYSAFARRHRTTIAVLAALGLLTGFVWSLGQPASYSATTSVVLAPVPKYVTASTVELVPPPVTIDTDAQLLLTPEVLRAVAQEVGVDEAAVTDHLSVAASPHTRVLHVTVSAASPVAAARAADAAVAALGRARRASLGALTTDQVLRLRQLVLDQEQLLAEAQARGTVVAAYDPLTAQIHELELGLAGLEEAHDEPVDPITPAVPPQAADYANREVPLTSGAMAGVLCGCLLGAARDRSRRPGVSRTALRPATRRRGDPPYPTTPEEDHHHVS
ncbi:hypothetical protein [Nocardioides dongkuii]|uniref:hypothetical protein n=1 Tax=Nocardioides dongkuii TaxID=2760089 RepID=UPI0015F85D25|nr:hypothetical protein [Nocardioides dongkuii]